jgi:hypothetical protein
MLILQFVHTAMPLESHNSIDIWTRLIKQAWMTSILTYRWTLCRFHGSFVGSGAEVLTESFDGLCSIADNRIILT